MLHSNLTTLLFPFLFVLLLLTPFYTDATPSGGRFYTAATRQGTQLEIGILPGFPLPTDGNGQIANNYTCWDEPEFVFRRRQMLMAAEGFCSTFDGQIVPDRSGKHEVEKWLQAFSSITMDQAIISAKVTVAKGVVWEVDGNVCIEVLRWLIDDCHTHGENVKSGGTVEICGVTFSLRGRETPPQD